MKLSSSPWSCRPTSCLRATGRTPSTTRGARVELLGGIEHRRLWQWPVYQLAGEIVTNEEINTVLDVGCGTGSKLNRFLLATTTRAG